MDCLPEADLTDICGLLKAPDAKCLCETIKNNRARYRANQFWFLKDRKSLEPGSAPRATIGPAFILGKKKNKEQESAPRSTIGTLIIRKKKKKEQEIEKQLETILYKAIFHGEGDVFRPLALSRIPFRCEWPLYTKPIKGWIQGIDAKAWFSKLSRCHKKWKNQRIFEFLKLSTYSLIPFDGALTSALLALWDPALNCFVLGRGLMTVTLADIAFITGLSPSGLYGEELPVFKVLPKAESTYNEALELYHKIVKTGLLKCGFQTIVSYFTSEQCHTASKRGEEVLFLTFAFSRLMMPKVGGFTTLFLSVAANIVAAEEGPIGLGPILLGQLYRCLYRCKEASMTLKDDHNSSLENVFGPLWLITCWGFMYFRSLMVLTPEEELKKEMDDECQCYGEVAFNRLSTTTVRKADDVMKSLLDTECQCYWSYINISKENVNDSTDFWTKECLPAWLKSLLMTKFCEKVSYFWNSVLYSRDLIAAEPEYFGFEAYNPQLVARQFGLCQSLALPLCLTQNNPWDKKGRYEEMSAYKSETLIIRSQSLTPWSWSDCITTSFRKFWKSYIHEMQDIRTEALKHFTSCIVFRGKKRESLENELHIVIPHGSKCSNPITIDDSEESQEGINAPIQSLSRETKCFFIPESSLKRGVRKCRSFGKFALVEKESSPETAENVDFDDATPISQVAKKLKLSVGSGNNFAHKTSVKGPRSNLKRNKLSPSNKKQKLLNTLMEGKQANSDESVATESLMHLSKSSPKDLDISKSANNKGFGEQVCSLDTLDTRDTTQEVIDLDFLPRQEMLVNGEHLGQVSNPNSVSHQQTLSSDDNPCQIVHGKHATPLEEPNSKQAEDVTLANTEQSVHISVPQNECPALENGGGQDSILTQEVEIRQPLLNQSWKSGQISPPNTSTIFDLDSMEDRSLQSLKNTNNLNKLPAKQHILSVVSKLKEDKMDLKSSQELAALMDKYLQAGEDEWDPLYYMVQDDIIPLQRQVIKLQQQFSQHTEYITQAQSEITSFQEQLLRIGNHSNRVNELTSELSVVQQLIEDLQKQLDEARHAEKLINDELSALRRQIQEDKIANDQKKVQVQVANQLLKDFRKSKGQGAAATRKLDMFLVHIEEECLRLTSKSG